VDEKTLSPRERIEAVEKRRAERKVELAKEREAQEATDLEAIDALEMEHGAGGVARLDLERFAKGLPTCVALRTPDPAQYKRFVDQVGKAVEKNNQGARRDAQDLFAKSCWAYPAEQEARDRMLEQFPGLLVSIAIRAAQLVEAKAAEEGKG